MMATALRGTARERSISLNILLLLRTPIRPLQKLNRVMHPDVEPPLPEALLYLQGAAGVPACHHVGARLLDPLDLPVEELLSQVGIQQIVGPGTSATEVRFHKLHDL